MNCPNCAQRIDRGAAICPFCGEAIAPKAFRPWRALVIALSWVIALAVFGVGVYKLYYWIDEYRLTRLYTRGALRPSITQITLADGRAGHAIAYFGEDGDKVFFEALNQTIEFSGGVARLQIADSDWFGRGIEEVESAEVTVSAMLIHETGDKRRLPALNFEIPAPQSPIQVINPKSDDLAINTSIYKLEVRVVPGSAVTVNGKDVTDIVDRTGLLSVNVNVFPVGENNYSIIVNTPSHKEARRDVKIHRAEMEIPIEIDSSVEMTTSSDVVTITGKCDPSAAIVVDTEFLPGSILQDAATGSYSFIAQMTAIGENTVRFRATAEGKADSVISLTIDYLPDIDTYSRRAWALDYDELVLMFEQWKGKRIFKCVGIVVDVFYEEDNQFVVMDVGPEDVRQLLVLENRSSLGTPARGGAYTAYADVSGRKMYDAHYYPSLVARYMDITPD
ncbi:MAG: hypothetical protein ACOYI5_11370 [Christensenellales bacterium]